MTEYLFQFFDQFVEWATNNGALPVWLAISAILALTGVGLPTPEDIWLILAGFLCYKSGFLGRAASPEDVIFLDYVATWAFCAGSNVTGDVACWWLGKKFGLPLRERISLFKKMLSDKRLKKVNRWFERWGGLAVFFGRMVAGIRFVVFFTAGVTRMNLAKFIFWDCMGCLLSIPHWLFLGYLGASVHGTERYAEFQSWVKDTGIWVFIIGAVLIIGFVVYLKFFAKKDPAVEELAEEAVDEAMGALGVEESLREAENHTEPAPDQAIPAEAEPAAKE